MDLILRTSCMKKLAIRDVKLQYNEVITKFEHKLLCICCTFSHSPQHLAPKICLENHIVNWSDDLCQEQAALRRAAVALIHRA